MSSKWKGRWESMGVGQVESVGASVAIVNSAVEAVRSKWARFVRYARRAEEEDSRGASGGRGTVTLHNDKDFAEFTILE